MRLEFNAPGIDKPNRGAWPTDIRDPDDEMVATGFIHVERMDDNAWWVGIYTADGRCVHINFWTKRAKIYSSMEDQGEDRLWQERMDSAPAAEAGRAEGQEPEAIAQAMEEWSKYHEFFSPEGLALLENGAKAIRAAEADRDRLKAALQEIADNGLVHHPCWTARAALEQWRWATLPTAPQWFVDAANAALAGEDPDPQDYEYEHREMNR